LRCVWCRDRLPAGLAAAAGLWGKGYLSATFCGDVEAGCEQSGIIDGEIAGRVHRVAEHDGRKAAIDGGQVDDDGQPVKRAVAAGDRCDGGSGADCVRVHLFRFSELPHL
jgi:hypothetical protein